MIKITEASVIVVNFGSRDSLLCLHRMMRMWVQLLCILIHLFQLPANWLDVFLYNELYPPQNDANKYVICNNYFISGIGSIP